MVPHGTIFQIHVAVAVGNKRAAGFIFDLPGNGCLAPAVTRPDRIHRHNARRMARGFITYLRPQSRQFRINIGHAKEPLREHLKSPYLNSRTLREELQSFLILH